MVFIYSVIWFRSNGPVSYFYLSKQSYHLAQSIKQVSNVHVLFQFVVHVLVGHQDGLGLVRQELWREQVPERGDRLLIQEILLLCSS